MRNESFYQRIKLRSEDKFVSFIDASNWWKIVLGIGLFVVAAPFLPGRYSYRIPKNEAEVFHRMLLAAFSILFLSVIFLWLGILRPYLNYRLGYNKSGTFEVCGKVNILGWTMLTLRPGTNHLIRVDRQFFKFIKVGDRVLIERRALGDLIRIRKV